MHGTLRTLRRLAICLALSIAPACGGARPEVHEAHEASASVDWQEWNEASFARAQREGKLILVSVQAGWCHWCHVMNDTTYRDPAVLAVLRDRFVAVRVDSDQRPDLAERYAEWGWPATAILTPDAQPVIELRGHQPSARFKPLLDELTAELDSGRPMRHRAPEALPPDPRLADLSTMRDVVRTQLDRMYDQDIGGWGSQQKYPFPAPVEHAFFRARVRGEADWQARALLTLENTAKLIDPVSGGMYQYSVGGTWDEPHFEKIAQIQAGAIENFIEAYQATGDEQWLGHARDVLRYVATTLHDEAGGFYTSQDADLGTRGDYPFMDGHQYYRLDAEARREAGIPFVDRNVYASLNGMLIGAIAKMYEATGDAEVLALATSAADRLIRTHREESGGFVHGEEERGRGGLLHLADQIWMARALFALYEATGEARYREAADASLAFMQRELEDAEHGGYFAHTRDPAAVGVFAERRRPLIENGLVARLLIQRHRKTGDAALRTSAERALRAIGETGEIPRRGRKVGELLLALEELDAPYAILSVVGPEDDARTAPLFAAALAFYHPTRLVELGRPGSSRYPYPGEPAVYLCTQEACSLPVSDPQRLADAARTFIARSER